MWAAKRLQNFEAEKIFEILEIDGKLNFLSLLKSKIIWNKFNPVNISLMRSITYFNLRSSKKQELVVTLNQDHWIIPI